MSIKMIHYNEMRYIIPEPFDKCYLGKDATKMITVPHRFNDKDHQVFVKLPAFAVAIYDKITGAELSQDYDLMQKGITWFQKNFTKEYFELLD